MVYVGEQRLELRRRLLELEQEFSRANLLAEFDEYRKRLEQLRIVNLIRTATGQVEYASVAEMVADKG